MLQVSHLRKSFATAEGVVNVIDDVSFGIDEGRCYVLLGPSGCGKTTTLRCVAGLEHADSGRIEIGGTVVSDPQQGIYVPVHQRPIGMVFQSYAIWPHLDVFENVAYPLRVQRPVVPRAEIRERVDEVLALVGMQALAQRAASRLSGGQQQRVALARALVRRPKLLLLDEPLSNLDARLRETMRQELSDMIGRVGVTALFVTHDQIEAFALADRVAVMHRGHIVQEGTPRQIYGRPSDTFVATFLGSANVLSGRMDGAGAGARRPLLLDTRSGSVRLLLDSEHPAGQSVELVVRPEDVRLELAAPPADTPALRGHLRQVSFLGGMIEYDIDVDGATVRALGHSAQELQPGQPVWLHFDPSRCAVFAK
jgi:iron(III) transport system ATP-binding protein